MTRPFREGDRVFWVWNPGGSRPREVRRAVVRKVHARSVAIHVLDRWDGNVTRVSPGKLIQREVTP